MLDAEMLERPANLRRPRTGDLVARLVGRKMVAAPILIKAQRQAVPAKHFRQSRERRGRAFLGRQKGRVDRARRIVQRDDQIERRLAQSGACGAAPELADGLVQHHAGKSAIADACAGARHVVAPSPASLSTAGTSLSPCSPR